MDVRELKDKASQLFSKGKFSKAAETYEEYCAADRKDHLARLRCGDAWSKAGKKDRAIHAYSQAAEGFARDGFLPRAIAASKLVLEIDPNHKAVQKMLADLYSQKRGAPAPRSSTVSGLRAGPAASAEVSRGVASPGTAAGFTSRRDAIDLEAPPSKSATPARPAPATPAPTHRPDAIELPTYEVPLGEAAAAVEATGHRPMTSVAAIELDLEPSAPAPAASTALVETSIEIELSSGQPVTGEVEIPIEGQPLPDADQLPAELQVQPATPSLSTPVDPMMPPAPSAPIFELTVEADAPAPAAPPSATFELAVEAVRSAPAGEPSTSGVYDLSDEAPDEALAAAAASEALDEAAESPATSGVYDLSDELPEPSPAATLAPPPSAPGEAAEPLTATPLPPSVGAAPPPPGIAPVKPTEAALPPGLRPRRAAEAPAAAATGPSRIWLPPGFAPPKPAEASTTPLSGVSASPPDDAEAATDLERGLQAFMQFDPDAAPALAAAPAVAAAAGGFTELDLEGDSLLHAVEAAAAAVAPAGPVVEEVMEAPEEAKPEPGDLPKIPLFSDLPEDAFIALFEKCPLQRFDAGQLVFEAGDKADAFYVICGGSTRVFRVEDGKRRELATLEEGSFFGELALLSDAPRSACVEAAEDDTQVLVISAEVLRELSSAHPAVATALKKFSRQRMLTNLMNNAPLFAPFNRSDRRDLVQKFRARDVPRGEVLVREGQGSDGLYVVLYGEVEVVAKDRTLATLREGQVFGEMSLLQRTPASATVRATRHTSLLRLPKADFDTLILSHPQVLEHVAELIDERQKANAAAGML